MGEFEQKIANTVNDKLSDGTVEKLIEQHIEKAVSEALDNIFRYGGKGNKLIKNKLDEVIVPVIEKHDFNRYIVKLDAVLTEIINNTNLVDNKQILENFQGLLKEPEFKEIKLSEIFKKYCKHVAVNVDTYNLEACCEDGEPYYQHVTAGMKVEYADRGWWKPRFDDCYVRFTCEEDKELNCELKLYKNVEEEKWSILSGIHESIEINSLRNLSEFEVFLYTLKRGFVKIIIDTEDECDDDIEPDEKPEWSLN